MTALLVFGILDVLALAFMTWLVWIAPEGRQDEHGFAVMGPSLSEKRRSDAMHSVADGRVRGWFRSSRDHRAAPGFGRPNFGR